MSSSRFPIGYWLLVLIFYIILFPIVREWERLYLFDYCRGCDIWNKLGCATIWVCSAECRCREFGRPEIHNTSGGRFRLRLAGLLRRTCAPSGGRRLPQLTWLSSQIRWSKNQAQFQRVKNSFSILPGFSFIHPACPPI